MPELDAACFFPKLKVKIFRWLPDLDVSFPPSYACVNGFVAAIRTNCAVQNTQQCFKWTVIFFLQGASHLSEYLLSSFP